MNVALATRRFKTKTAAKAHFKNMLARYQPGEHVSGDDAVDLEALLERHSDRELKLGSGVDSFFVKQTKYGSKCFCVQHTDGSVDDISYLHCVDGRPPTMDGLYAKAAREAVKPDILAFRNRYFASGPAPCAVTGMVIDVHESNVDHYPVSFVEILNMFRLERGYVPTYATISEPAALQVTASFTAPDIEQQFRDFHNTFALRIVHKSVQH